MLIHTIGWGPSGAWNPNTFMFKYIFPGAEIPHMSHFAEPFNDRWHLEDFHSIGKSYPKTGRLWLANLGDWSGLEEECDERFRRMWWYYIFSCCSSFERRRTKLWQLVYTKTNSSRPDDCHYIRAGAEPVSEPIGAGGTAALHADDAVLKVVSETAHTRTKVLHQTAH